MNERRSAILLMVSTGMRVRALPGIKLKHVKKWTIDNSADHVYQITVYASSSKDKYFTFCTPKTAKAIDVYLDLRARIDDDLNPDSYLFI